MLHKGDFRENLFEMIKYPDSFTKEEYYDAFLIITEKYVNELIMNLNSENVILSHLGDEKGSALIEAFATSNPDLEQLDEELENMTTRSDRIKALMDYAEYQYGYRIGAEEDVDRDMTNTEEDVVKGILAKAFDDRHDEDIEDGSDDDDDDSEDDTN